MPSKSELEEIIFNIRENIRALIKEDKVSPEELEDILDEIQEELGLEDDEALVNDPELLDNEPDSDEDDED